MFHEMTQAEVQAVLIREQQRIQRERWEAARARQGRAPGALGQREAATMPTYERDRKDNEYNGMGVAPYCLQNQTN
jgi:hypothetical protein